MDICDIFGRLGDTIFAQVGVVGNALMSAQLIDRGKNRRNHTNLFLVRWPNSEFSLTASWKSRYTLALALRQASSVTSSLILGQVIIQVNVRPLSKPALTHQITYPEDRKGLHLSFDTTANLMHLILISLLNKPWVGVGPLMPWHPCCTPPEITPIAKLGPGGHPSKSTPPTSHLMQCSHRIPLPTQPGFNRNLLFLLVWLLCCWLTKNV